MIPWEVFPCSPHFRLALFLIGAISLVTLPVGVILQSHFRNRDRRTVICPDNQEPATVEMDKKYAFATARLKRRSF